jgi:hypothetical protein
VSGLIGLAIGAVSGFAGYLVLTFAAARSPSEPAARALRTVGMLELVSMPIVGYLIGAFVFG